MIEALPGISLLAVFSLPLGAGLWHALRGRGHTTASMRPNGVQEAEIIVRGSYYPDTITLRAGVPARLLFNRQEDSPCSERVIFLGLGQEQLLAPFATTTVQFIPVKAGEFPFTCAMGMYQGRLLVYEQPEHDAPGRLGMVQKWLGPAKDDHAGPR